MYCFACDACLMAVIVVGDPDDIRRLITHHPMWKDGLPCVREGCLEKMYQLDVLPDMLRSQANVLEQVELTPEELFRAMGGFGLPEEIGFAPEMVRALLLSSKVVGMSADKVVSGRVILDRLDLEDGTSLHLASSRQGPVVFKVTRRRDANEGNDHVDVQPDTENDGVRDEAGCGQGGCSGRCQCAGTPNTQLLRTGGRDGGYARVSERDPAEISRCYCDDDRYIPSTTNVRRDET